MKRGATYMILKQLQTATCIFNDDTPPMRVTKVRCVGMKIAFILARSFGYHCTWNSAYYYCTVVLSNLPNPWVTEKPQKTQPKTFLLFCSSLQSRHTLKGFVTPNNKEMPLKSLTLKPWWWPKYIWTVTYNSTLSGTTASRDEGLNTLKTSNIIDFTDKLLVSQNDSSYILAEN
jgi:hypothetical protein